MPFLLVRFLWASKENESGDRFTLNKLHDDNTLVVLSPALHKMTSFRQAGMYKKGIVRYMTHDFTNSFRPVWEVYLYHLNNIQVSTPKMSIPITLGSYSFQQQKDAIPYLNKVVNDPNITFSLTRNNVLKLKITDEKTSVTFSDTLRDIFAFDQNTYSWKGTFSGSSTFSLARRIHYLYIYSSVSDYIRIGDTEAPLLAIIPFNSDVCVNLLQEKTFKTPMYVPVIQNRISQIDIAIYDGAGELVPFASDAVTSLRLHFRQL